MHHLLYPPTNYKHARAVHFQPSLVHRFYPQARPGPVQKISWKKSQARTENNAQLIKIPVRSKNFFLRMHLMSALSIVDWCCSNWQSVFFSQTQELFINILKYTLCFLLVIIPQIAKYYFRSVLLFYSVLTYYDGIYKQLYYTH